MTTERSESCYLFDINPIQKTKKKMTIHLRIALRVAKMNLLNPGG